MHQLTEHISKHIDTHCSITDIKINFLQNINCKFSIARIYSRCLLNQGIDKEIIY